MQQRIYFDADFCFKKSFKLITVVKLRKYIIYNDIEDNKYNIAETSTSSKQLCN